MKKTLVIATMSLALGLLAGMLINAPNRHKDDVIAIQSDIIRCCSDWYGSEVYAIAQDYLSVIGEDTSLLKENVYCY